ncbi:hypothetical protein NW762_014126 [Fusarium torreyae]|uniref:PRISE-like Rossmann-fold domain-containing protein n=1 Tax=Fusarium torreyae TaxID=1237075 RepID=A0A9W8RJE0_9HYPO|nr:hypothetical protein NW762_014126 [Fusarium torreyae]
MTHHTTTDFSVKHCGVYRNLPVLGSATNDLTAIVPGATGISGWNTIRSLLESPDRWTKIYAMSRSPPKQELLDLLPAEQQLRVHHLPVDFSGSAADVASSLKQVRGERLYVFFYAYLQPKTEEHEGVWQNVEKLKETNEKLFSTFLEALELADLKPRRILLQTGGKNYGMQIGRAPAPWVESDPQPRHLDPNFYYGQEDALHAYCQRHPETSWNVTRPAGVMGSALNAQMNFLYLCAVYAAVQANKQQPIYFPGDWNSWQAPLPLSTARLTGFQSEWAVLKDECKDQAFNCEDMNNLTHQRLLAELARWYGAKGVEPPPTDENQYQQVKGRGGDECPLGHGPPTEIRFTMKMADWARDVQTQQAWQRIMEHSNGKVTINPFEESVLKDNFEFLHICLTVTGTMSMNKARLLGWTGFVDTLEAAFESCQEMARMGLLPPVVVDAPRPMV